MRRIAFFLGLVLAALAAPSARAEGIEVLDARLRAAEDGMLVEAEFEVELTPRLAEVVANGVPVYFRVEFELSRPRWYWFDEKTASRHMHLRLSYHALSRQYRLSAGMLQQSFATLEEALNVLERVRNWLVVDRTVSFANADYQAAVRMRLDTALLPKPFQLSALLSRDMQLESAWRRFTVRSPKQLPAPVETREPLAETPR
jgi:Domain of unknown function (DUF4390)